MDSYTMYDSAMHRQSVRHLLGDPLTRDVIEEVQSAFEDLHPLFPKARIRLTLYKRGEVKGYSRYGIAAFAPNTRESWINAGYMLEQMDLWLSSRNLGSCWLGAAKAPSELVPPGMIYMASVCFGVPIGPSHREDLTDIKRKPIDGITDIDPPGPILEFARLAPSALNRQPWFFSGTQEHMMLCTGSVLMAKNLTLLDTGIVLLYVRIAAIHFGKVAHVSLEEPKDLKMPKGRSFQAEITIEDSKDDNG